MTLTQINKAGLDEIALDHVFTIGASGSSAYTFQGEGLNGTVNNPTRTLQEVKRIDLRMAQVVILYVYKVHLEQAALHTTLA